MAERVAEGWTRARVADIAAPQTGAIAIGPFGSALKSDVYTDDGVPVLRGQDIGEGRALLTDGLVFVPEHFAEALARAIVRDGDLVFPHRGAIGRVGLVENAVYLLSSSLMKLTVDKARHDPAFFLYYFRGPGRAELLQRASTVGTPGIGQPLSSLRGIEVVYPSLKEQQAIAEVLGALDDKIAANGKLSATAERLSSMIFASMLAEARPAPLSTTAEFVNGRAFTKGASGTGRVVVRIAELNSGIGRSTVYSDIDVPDQHVARPGDILFAWSGSLTMHRWFRGDAIVNQHIFKVIPKAGYPAWLVWQLVASRLEAFKSIAADKATTMGHIQRRHLDEPVDVPARPAVEAHHAHMQALWDRALVAEQENVTLAAIRDALLPALMSGRLRVRDAERIVSDAV